VISGKKTVSPHSSCQIAGVPMFMGYGGGNPSFSCKPPRKSGCTLPYCRCGASTWMYLTPKSEPSWYGESVAIMKATRCGRYDRV